MEYKEFLERKKIYHSESGFDSKDIDKRLFDYQKDIVEWCCKLGKSALFTMTGTGKTLMELEFSRQVFIEEKKNILIVSPLAVSHQFIKEGLKIDVEVNEIRKNGIKKGINIINYEQLHNINADEFIAVILDESSILKNYSGKIRNEIINKFRNTKYKLCGTATPSPNDYQELGNHSEFLDVMKRKEMLSTFFIHDSAHTQDWRLKKHAEDEYWKWLSSWACVMTKPSDLGYKETYVLPKLNIEVIQVKTDIKLDEYLFPINAESLDERRKARQLTVSDRVKKVKEIVESNNDYNLIWCDYNIESELLHKNIYESVEVKGADTDEKKEKALFDFSDGNIKNMITKPKIAGFGLNWQHCNNIIFCGLSDSYEQYFQAIRRCYRYGQKRDVNVYIVVSDIEANVLENIKRKEKKMNEMINSVIEHTRSYIIDGIKNHKKLNSNYIAVEDIKFPMFLKSEA